MNTIVYKNLLQLFSSVNPNSAVSIKIGNRYFNITKDYSSPVTVNYVEVPTESTGILISKVKQYFLRG